MAALEEAWRTWNGMRQEWNLVVTAWTIKFIDDARFSESTALIKEEFSKSDDEYKENKGDAQQLHARK